MGTEHAPAIGNTHPHVGEAALVLVGPVVEMSALVVGASDDGDHTATHVKANVRLFRSFDLNRWIGAVRDIARFAIGSSILNCNDEIFGKEVGKGVKIALFVGFGPFLLELAHLSPAAPQFLCSRTYG